jgi:hypothetical protein
LAADHEGVLASGNDAVAFAQEVGDLLLGSLQILGARHLNVDRPEGLVAGEVTQHGRDRDEGDIVLVAALK